MAELLRLHHRAVNQFGVLVGRIRADQWADPTPCAEWSVRDLVNHLAGEQLWVPRLLAGETVAEVGDAYDGDVLGEDPADEWDRAAEEACIAWEAEGALQRTVHLSYGDVPGERYCRQLTHDAAIHGWDLARAIGADDTIPAELVDLVWRDMAGDPPHHEAPAMFDEPVEVPADAGPQTRLLALFGRRWDWVAG